MEQRLANGARNAEVLDAAQHLLELGELCQRDEVAYSWTEVARAKEAFGVAIAGPVHKDLLWIRRRSFEGRRFPRPRYGCQFRHRVAPQSHFQSGASFSESASLL